MALTRHKKFRPVLIAAATAVTVGGTGAAYACGPWAGNGTNANAAQISNNSALPPGPSQTTEAEEDEAESQDTPTAAATTPSKKELREHRRKHRHHHRPGHGQPTTTAPTTDPGEPDDPSDPDDEPTSQPTGSTDAPPDTPSTEPTKPTTEPTKPTTTTPPAGAGGTLAQYQAKVLELTNAERKKAGCNVALTANAALTKSAQGHAEDMLKNNYFSHDSQDGTSPFERMTAAGYTWAGAAENIAAGQSSPEAVMKGWMNSAGHKANILNCGLTELGVGYAAGSGAAYGQYWVQNFGSPRK
ncbi:CAP domain-containing protein [Kineosporia babensis]|uniref:CAP domain-containing protein n=1 Tax=Kineosporia babensis TaxID=499548 RepID=A0A9X1NHG8_9ACTN|nr:CAP domain-containing protein [Kineosporia babensis]MCD5314055.1 CAP domain-containing protein [Kineosporia babensis]